MREEELRARIQAFVQASLKIAVPIGIGLALAGCGTTEKYGAAVPDDAAVDASTDLPGADSAPRDGTAVLDGMQTLYAALFPGPGAPGK